MCALSCNGAAELYKKWSEPPFLWGLFPRRPRQRSSPLSDRALTILVLISGICSPFTRSPSVFPGQTPSLSFLHLSFIPQSRLKSTFSPSVSSPPSPLRLSRGPSVLLIKSNEVIYQGLLFFSAPQHKSLRVKEAIPLSPRVSPSARWTQDSLSLSLRRPGL